MAQRLAVDAKSTRNMKPTSIRIHSRSVGNSDLYLAISVHSMPNRKQDMQTPIKIVPRTSWRTETGSCTCVADMAGDEGPGEVYVCGRGRGRERGKEKERAGRETVCV